MPTNQAIIESAYADLSSLTADNASTAVLSALEETLSELDKGLVRVAEKTTQGAWQVHEWIKKAILISFKLKPAQPLPGSTTQYFDKVPLKYARTSESEFIESQVRVVPPATVRHGAYIGANTVLMPSYVNIGAFVDTGCMIDTWATVGSCAQIGKNVHLSGGAGIGGVLEPLQATPTIIEDNCFIGARSEVVEGVIVGEGSVLSMGVYLGQSTRIYNRTTGKVSYGHIPPGSVVVPGSLPAKDGSHSLYCAIIVKQVDEKTRSKVSVNELLRDIGHE